MKLKKDKEFNKNQQLAAQEILDAQEEEKVDLYSMDVAVERVEGGLVGTLRIDNDINKPIFKPGDLVALRRPNRLQIKDFVLYESHDEYFLRRIIKFVEDDIYVAGDNEKEYRIIRQSDVVAKVISRQRKLKNLSFALTPKKKFYTFKKVNLAKLRLGNRVTNYEQEVNDESLELAAMAAQKQAQEAKQQYKYDFDLETDLQSFINPDTLVMEIRNAMNGTPDETTDGEEEIEYVDEEGNVINPEDIEDAEDEEQIEYVDEEGNPIEVDEEALGADGDLTESSEEITEEDEENKSEE